MEQITWAELTEVFNDAARYRWLKINDSGWIRVCTATGFQYNSKDLDAAINEAMKDKKA